MNVVEEGEVDNVDDFIHLCEKLVDPRNKFCPGIDIEEYETTRKWCDTMYRM